MAYKVLSRGTSKTFFFSWISRDQQGYLRRDFSSFKGVKQVLLRDNEYRMNVFGDDD